MRSNKKSVIIHWLFVFRWSFYWGLALCEYRATASNEILLKNWCAKFYL